MRNACDPLAQHFAATKRDLNEKKYNVVGL